MPDVDDDDDLLDDLPPVGDLSAEDAGLDDDELGVGAIIGDGKEYVGLDDTVGTEDAAPLFALELPPEDAAADTGASDLDAIPVEGLGSDDEYGWTDQSPGGTDSTWDPADHDMPILTPLGRDDGGEEGLDEVFELGGADGDSVPHLPQLDADLDDDEDDPLDDAAFVALVPRARASELPSLYEAERCVAARLTPAIPIRSCLVTPHATWAVGDALFVIDGDHAARVIAGGLEERRSLSLAAGDDGHRLVVGTDRGIGRSVDRGASFAITGSMASGAFEVAREGDTDRIWAFSREGALHRSDDLGGVWSGPLLLKPVVALVTPVEGGVVALCAGQSAAPQLARSTDGGQRWAAVGVPKLPMGEGERPTRLSLAAAGELVAVASDADPQGPHLSTDAGKSWLRVPGLPTVLALAVARERGGVSVYAVHRGDEGPVLVRHRPDGGDSGALLELNDPDATVEGLVLERTSDEQTRVYVATSVGLYRVTLSLEAL